jgi:hypothetical protein
MVIIGGIDSSLSVDADDTEERVLAYAKRVRAENAARMTKSFRNKIPFTTILLKYLLNLTCFKYDLGQVRHILSHVQVGGHLGRNYLFVVAQVPNGTVFRLQLSSANVAS